MLASDFLPAFYYVVGGIYLRNKIHLETVEDAKNFSDIASHVHGDVRIVDAVGHCVNAKSLLGAIYSLEFEDLWVESDRDIYSKIERYIC